MKIENDHPIPFAKTKAPSTRPADNPNFRTVFDQSLQAAANSNRVSQSLTVTRTPAATATSLGPSVPEQTALKGFEDLLGTLSTYQERLGDGRVSLRMLARDLNRLDDQCHQLDRLAQNLPSGGELLALLKEGLMTARMEMVRFQRGDYC